MSTPTPYVIGVRVLSVLIHRSILSISVKMHYSDKKNMFNTTGFGSYAASVCLLIRFICSRMCFSFSQDSSHMQQVCGNSLTGIKCVFFFQQLVGLYPTTVCALVAAYAPRGHMYVGVSVNRILEVEPSKTWRVNCNARQ